MLACGCEPNDRSNLFLYIFRNSTHYLSRRIP